MYDPQRFWMIHVKITVCTNQYFTFMGVATHKACVALLCMQAAIFIIANIGYLSTLHRIHLNTCSTTSRLLFKVILVGCERLCTLYSCASIEYVCCVFSACHDH